MGAPHALGVLNLGRKWFTLSSGPEQADRDTEQLSPSVDVDASAVVVGLIGTGGQEELGEQVVR